MYVHIRVRKSLSRVRGIGTRRPVYPEMHRSEVVSLHGAVEAKVQRGTHLGRKEAGRPDIGEGTIDAWTSDLIRELSFLRENVAI